MHWGRLIVAKGLPKTPSGQSDPGILLGVLAAVESDAQVTQRKLSRDLGIALGLANLYLKRCAHKGWIKFNQVPMRRYAYYLTPQGFTEKARLTGEYLTWNLEFFRRARRDATDLFAQAHAKGLNRFLLVGAGELAEVATLSAGDAGVTVVAIIDPESTLARCAGIPVHRSAEEFRSTAGGAQGVDALMITQAGNILDHLGAIAFALDVPIAPERVLLPAMLKLSWPRMVAGLQEAST
jgi:hypothetical protein